MMKENKNIYKINHKYQIIKVHYGIRIYYGTFNSLDDALEKREILRKNRWQKNSTTGYPTYEHFPKYQIKTEDNKEYIIVNCNTGKTYGSYKNYKYATIIKQILPFFKDKVDIEKIEKFAIKEFYKYISYKKIKNKYMIIYHGTTMGLFSNLASALEERDIIMRYEGDEELMCQNTPIYYNYNKEELPPYPYTIEEIIYRSNKSNRYIVRKQIRNQRITIGQYATYNMAVLVRDYLDRNKWNLDKINHIKRVTIKIQKRDKFILHKGKMYYIIHNEQGKSVIYANYTNPNLARYVRDKLTEHNWNMEKIGEYEEEYKNNKEKNLHYYDNTDLFKTTPN